MDELEALGYVERAADPADRRAKLVRFTRAGFALLGEARSVVAEVWASYASLLGNQRLGALRAALDALLARIEEAEVRPRVGAARSAASSRLVRAAGPRLLPGRPRRRRAG